KSGEDDGFTLWSLDKYLHSKYQETNILVRYFLEALIIVTILIGPLIIAFLLMKKKVDVKKYFTPASGEDDTWEYLMRRNMFVSVWYVADVIFIIVTELFLSTGAAILVIFRLSQSALCWAFLQSVYSKRYYAHMCLTLLFGFYLSNRIYGEFTLPTLSLSTPLVLMLKAFILWFGIYMAMLFLAKVFINFSLFEVKRSAYTEIIYSLNYKAFVFKKMQLIGETTKDGGDVDEICQEYLQEYDDGLYLIYRESIFPSSDDAEECAVEIYKNLKKEELALNDIKKYFPTDYKEVFKYLAGVEVKDDGNTNEKIKKKQFVSTAIELYYARKDMERTLRGRDSVFNKLELIVSVIISYCALIILLLIFQMNARLFMASFGTSLLTFSWIFADSIKNIYSCFIFLLVIRPFNIGDKVVINGEILFVYKMDLLTSTFLTTYKKMTYISNIVLVTTNIYNIARSPAQTETLTLEVSESTTYDQAISLQKKASEQVKKAKSSFVDCAFRKITKGKLEYEILHKNNFQNSEQMKNKRNKIIRIFRKAMSSVGIEHSDSFEFSG
ncbi:hypothetical protein PAEPH01_2084, partial [Pancytospora epiphaga]